MSSNHLIAHRQFEMDSGEQNADALVEARKRAHEAHAQKELDENMGNTLADFQMWPTWTVENAESPGVHIYTLTMKVVFKP